MMRRLLFALALSLAASPVLAADVVSAWIRQLSLDGYEEMTVSRTWLGRTRIVAERGEVHREIILNTRTGEVLRDYSRSNDGSLRLPLGFDVELGEGASDDGGQDTEDPGDDSRDSPDSPDGGEDDESDESDDGNDGGDDHGGSEDD
jgi:hypothetical protein